MKEISEFWIDPLKPLADGTLVAPDVRPPEHGPEKADGNFGYAAGVNEMLVQSHMGYIHLLPALPEAWPAGSVRGPRARGGLEFDMQWVQGRLVRAEVRKVSGAEAKCEFRHAKGAIILALPAGGFRALQPGDFK
jgi:alpha-L-fucosidase 2